MSSLKIFPILFLAVPSIIYFISTPNSRNLSSKQTPVESAEPTNLRPVIGILTQPTKYVSAEGGKQSYIAASYVKQLEMAGAQVIPLLYDYDEDELRTLLSGINGVLFPGGEAEIIKNNSSGEKNLTYFGRHSKFITDHIVWMNEKGTYFPLFGTCLGHEIIAIAISEDYDVLSKVNSSNHCQQIEFNNYTNISKIFGSISENLLNYITDNNGAYYNHNYAVEDQNYEKDKKLNNFFHITSYSHDKNGTKFINTFEGKKLPVYSWQFHPEKPVFEWKLVDDINHSPEMVEFSQEIANFIVNEARKNNNSMSQTDLDSLLIYNYKTSRKNASSFEQLYFFDRISKN